ncbi:MAG: class I SAM-dependent methyltransferase [Ktedonobacteraceae bacterium]|nr:class I SAM-dependent methyltransferase [Ktedonobacteraceae bacterium]MBO0795068.1 class I SAM-dependent methyltransferase [Ktedonobacteraceae bacterium]
MPEESPTSETYILGHHSQEIHRLRLQGQLLNPFTRHLLQEAGISQGMRVLDIGCGPGDVSLLAAELVGQQGQVVGVDSNPAALAVAQRRAQEAGFSQICFQTADIHELSVEGQFDALVGRLILPHASVTKSPLPHLLTHLRQGGVVAFQEFDFPAHQTSTQPVCPLWEQAVTWCIEISQRAGVDTQMGMKLARMLMAEGLPAPQLRYEAAIGAGPSWLGYECLTELVRSLLPLIVQLGIATAQDIEIETLAERLREENRSLGSVARLPVLVSARTHLA